MGSVKGQRSGGHNRKPRGLRVVQGTFKPSRDYGADVQAPPGEPDIPPGLSDVALAEWTRVARHLKALGVLSCVDAPAIENYARLSAMASRLEATAAALGSLCYERVTVDGAGQEHREQKLHPVVSQLRSYRAALRQALSGGSG